MPPQHAAYVGGELSSALAAAHSATDSRGRPMRIVHRDVSPSNVISSYTGEVKLCDFGIAKATLSRVHTKTGVIKGKVKYMSPEQALGRKLDHRSDVFSLGSCLYEMLTRMPPFTASNEMDLLIKVRDAKFRPISDVVPDVPREVEAIANRCLARSRAHRYQSADEVAVALKDFLSGYKPDYSRSHLGRYVRKMFATEIEKELRMLEEYVVSNEVDEDLGENLIGDVLGPGAEFTNFSPKPAEDDGIGILDTNYDTVAEDSSDDEISESFDSLEFNDARTVVEDGVPKRPGRGAPAARTRSIHDDDTDILEHRRHRRKSGKRV